MTKFKVGDIIRANEKSNGVYCYTTQKVGWTGKVLSVDNHHLYVETIKPEFDKGETFHVLEDYFDFLDDNEIQNRIVNKNTVVIILQDGRKGVAKGNPTDRFNLAFGTALAVARAYGDEETEAKLLAEPVEPVKEKPKFKVGELVRIRQWDDMEKEFGTNDIGNILCENGFIKEMYPLCGLYAEIVSLDINGVVGLKFFNCEGLGRSWTYSTDMIEKV